MFFFQIRQLPTFLQQVQDLRQGRFPMHVAEEPFFFKRRIFNDNFPVEFPFQFQQMVFSVSPGNISSPVRHVPAVEASISRIELRPVSRETVSI